MDMPCPAVPGRHCPSGDGDSNTAGHGRLPERDALQTHPFLPTSVNSCFPAVTYGSVLRGMRFWGLREGGGSQIRGENPSQNKKGFHLKQPEGFHLTKVVN